MLRLVPLQDFWPDRSRDKEYVELFAQEFMGDLGGNSLQFQECKANIFDWGGSSGKRGAINDV